MRATIMFVLFVTLTACAQTPVPVNPTNKLVFLTRGDCVNTATMRARLDDALKSLELTTDYQFLDLDKMAPTDGRRGYPTPTVLFDGADLFGMTPAPPPFPDPT